MKNLAKEVEVVLGDKVNDDGVKHYDLWLRRELPQEDWPRIDGATDMGWQQKGTGHAHNSLVDHGCIFGRCTRKITAFKVRSEK